MPKREALTAADGDFNWMRLSAQLSPPSSSMRKEVSDIDWADFGRHVYTNMFDNERFKKAIVTASLKADTVSKGEAGDVFMRMLKLYLTTGTIGT